MVTHNLKINPYTQYDEQSNVVEKMIKIKSKYYRRYLTSMFICPTKVEQNELTFVQVYGRLIFLGYMAAIQASYPTN